MSATNTTDHAEAFRLMHYRSKDGTADEWIWNSRDGVTPFGVMSLSGVEMLHIDWANDPFDPYREPKVGDRVFVDLHPERAAQIASEFVDLWWDDPKMPMSDHPFFEHDKAIATRKMAASYFEHGTPPDLLTVNETLAERLAFESQLRRLASTEAGDAK